MKWSEVLRDVLVGGVICGLLGVGFISMRGCYEADIAAGAARSIAAHELERARVEAEKRGSCVCSP